MFKHLFSLLVATALVACSSTPSAPPANSSAPAATSSSSSSSSSATATAQGKNDYSKADSWLCRPGRQALCATDQAATVVAANGKLTPEAWKPSSNPAIDCFYVYPTVSREPTPNSGMQATDAERA